MKLLSLKNLILVVLLSAPVIYLKMLYDNLPEKVALHFGADMQPDRYGDKSELWTTVLILMGVSLFVYVIVANISKIDPKKQSLQSQTLMKKIGLSIVAFMSLTSIYIIFSSYNPTNGKFIFIMLGVLFAILGNLMYNVKPNYFVGIRLPWTLENEDNWRKTHHLGGKVWVGGGLLIVFLSIFLSPEWMSKIMLIIIFIIIFIPVIYSYKNYQKSKDNLQ